MRQQQILTKFTKEEEELIKRKAYETGLPKSTLVRMVTLKALANGTI